jgi:electron-transferring-flavoprotein dehydrogenase
MTDNLHFDVVVIGAGPAGLATAIQLKKKLNHCNSKASIIVIEKADQLSSHNLSGALFESECLDNLIPDWKQDSNIFIKNMLKQVVKHSDLYFLTKHLKFPILPFMRPSEMKHNGDKIISINSLIKWLAKKAVNLGVDVHTDFTGVDMLIENQAVKGIIVKTKDGSSEVIEANLTVFADGANSFLSKKLITAFNLDKHSNPQVYSIGIKQLVKLTSNKYFNPNRVIYTLGFPNKYNVFGGGFLYNMGDNLVSIGLSLGLDWPYCNLNPQQELELYKTHPFIDRLLKDSKVVASGAKLIPEGGFYSMPKVFAPRALIVGDAAGLVNMKKTKGLHLAINSGIAAGNTAFQAITNNDFSENTLKTYINELQKLKVISEMKSARNFRQVFFSKAGLLLGAPLSLIQQYLPFKLKTKADHLHTSSRKLLRHYSKENMDPKTFAYFAGVHHKDNHKPHIHIKDPAQCQKCRDVYGCPCTNFCPAKVYNFAEEKQNSDDLIEISSSDCLHDRSCVVKCPYQNIDWELPIDGQGPRYGVDG